MVVDHFSHVRWDPQRWPNFKAEEFACRHCGEFFVAADVFDRVQEMRFLLGRPLVVASGHRCRIWNAAVGGAPLSEHKKIAVDLMLAGHTPHGLLEAARAVGFTSFGFYGSFLHCDRRPGRKWWTEEGERVWSGLIQF